MFRLTYLLTVANNSTSHYDYDATDRTSGQRFAGSVDSALPCLTDRIMKHDLTLYIFRLNLSSSQSQTEPPISQ